jgi:hypothetical protein
MEKLTAFVYDEDTNECLVILTGNQPDVEWEATARFEQHGTPCQYSPFGLTGVEAAEIVDVTA